MNQNPEQLARDEIDRQLIACGWVIQNKKAFNLAAGVGVVIRRATECTSSILTLINYDLCPLFIPSIEQQQKVQEIESRLSVCDKIEETITDSVKQAEALRQSILKKEFEGKLNNE